MRVPLIAANWKMNTTIGEALKLVNELRQGLAAVPGVALHDLGRRQCGIVSFLVADQPPEETRRRLAERGINVSVSRAASTRLDMDARGLTDLVRASVHYYNTEDEVERLCQAVAACRP